MCYEGKTSIISYKNASSTRASLHTRNDWLKLYMSITVTIETSGCEESDQQSEHVVFSQRNSYKMMQEDGRKIVAFSVRLFMIVVWGRRKRFMRGKHQNRPLVIRP